MALYVDFIFVKEFIFSFCKFDVKDVVFNNWTMQTVYSNNNSQFEISFTMAQKIKP